MNKRRQSKRSQRGRATGKAGQSEAGGSVPPSGFDRITRETGKLYLALTTASSHLEYPLSPFIDPRLSVLAAEYELYRFKWVKFTLFPTDNATNNEYALGFVPDRPNSVGFPASIAEVIELAQSIYMANKVVVPQWLIIATAGLLGRTALKWWDTDTTALESTVQGRIFLRSNQASVICNVQLEYEIEFCNPIPATVTLQRLQKFNDLGILSPQTPDRLRLVGGLTFPEGRQSACEAKLHSHAADPPHALNIRCACGSCKDRNV